MITEDYVSFEISKLLKEKGFDEPIWTHYEDNDEVIFGDKYNWNNSPMGQTSAPTLQMAMKWLREIYDIFIVIRRGLTGTGWIYSHEIYKDSKCWYARYGASYDTYEEAIETAIKYCLENLI